MKVKRIIGMLSLVIMLALTICTIYTPNTYAANSSYTLGITNIREAQDGKQGAAYGIGGLKSDGTPTKKVWKIVSYANSGSNIIDYSNAFYCIEAEHGFVSNTGTGDVSQIKKTYDTSFNMKTESAEVITRLNAINTAISDEQVSQETYNKMMWIIDNMYLPKASNASGYKQQLMQISGITNAYGTVLLTNDDIEVIQQLALWYFTNPNDVNYHKDDLHGNPILPILLFNDWSGQDSNYNSLENLYDDSLLNIRDGLNRQKQAQLLYEYFIKNAKSDYNSTQTVTLPITLDKSNYKAEQVNDKYIIGPLKITAEEKRIYNITEMLFKDQAGNTITFTGENKLLDSNKAVVHTGNIADVIGQDFYISLPVTTTVKSINFSLKGNYTITDALYYTTSANTYLDEQPVILVENNTLPIELQATVALPKLKEVDLVLRKSITKINGVELSNSRLPVVDLAKLISGKSTTAEYNHSKVPVAVKKGDIVTYTIRVYNEGELDGYATEITDHLPEQLEFLPDDEENLANGWYYDENDLALRTIKTNHLSKDTDTDNLIKAFDGTTLSYKDITIKCKVKSTAQSGEKITNIADITYFTDANGNATTDRDSKENNVVLPTDIDLPNYKDEEINSGISYIPGQQDDDDFEKLQIKVFDLALRKFITAVDNNSITNRIPTLSIGEDGNIKYTHTKEPVEVQTNNIVTYTLRIFNEGDISGYAHEITDDLPEGLEFLPENELNKTYRWIMIDENGNETKDVTKAVKVTTDYLSKEQESEAGENLIKAFDKLAGLTDNNPDYRDIKISFKVIEPNTSDRILTNIAQISDDTDEDGNPVEDNDSLPANDDMAEDDIDVEHVKLVYFDLALRKFITKVDNLDVNNRYPVLSMGEDGNIKYTHTKEPVEVENGDIVTYTLRIFNEGEIDGYASEITDNLPESLEFLPENELNKTYRWIMIDKDGNKTEDITKAVKITTDYLSKEQEVEAGANLIKAFDKEVGITESNPDYKDVKIAFKVTEPNTSDRILINTAEISDDTNKDGNPVVDEDSTPGNDKDGEDDIDIEKVKVKYFDLALKKWVTQVIITENGKQTVTNTGHTGDENPEPVVKVDLKDKKLNKVTVKFAYKIKVINEGQIDGYAKEVKDYIPDGLKFVAEDNPLWKKVNDKEVVTDQLKDRLLRPGESATVDIILTWENSEDNLGVKVNIAEISKDYNNSNTPDIDSTPDNKKEEDDIDDASVILSIKTGEVTMYFTLTGTILAILAVGVILIKKYVL